MNRCIVLLDGGDYSFFLGRHGEHTTNSKDVMIFSSELDAQIYIDKHGIDHIACIRHIVQGKPKAVPQS